MENAEASKAAATTEAGDKVEKEELEQPAVVEEVVPPTVVEDRDPVTVDLKSLLKAGAHFGHQTRRWNPKMIPYIFGERNQVHIINLDTTLELWERTRKYICDISSRGGSILFVGTKPNIRQTIKTEAERCGAFSVTSRWLGGTLSNFGTIKQSIDRIHRLEELLKKASDEDSEVRLNKKERLSIARDLEKLEVNLGGIRNMKKHPDLIFVVDINKESIAVAESRKLHIPVVALVDTNVNPDLVDFPIPSNDDSVRTVGLFTAAVADAVIEGRRQYAERMPKGKSASNQKASQTTPEANGGSGTDKQDDEAPAPEAVPAAG